MARQIKKPKRYYWWRLRKNFFTQITIKKLRRSENGDTKAIIYLQMVLMTIDNDGYIQYEGVEADICDEIAIALDEEPDMVKETVEQLKGMGLIEMSEEDYFLPEAKSGIDSECDSAERVRKCRANKKMLQSNDNVTESNEKVTNCNTQVTQRREEERREEESREEKEESRVKKEIKNNKRGEFVREGENNNSVEYLDMFRSNVGHDEKSNQGYSDFTGIVGMFNEICKSFEHIDNQEEYTETHSNIFIDCFNKGYSEEDYRIAFNKAENSDYLKGTAENDKKKNKPSELSWMLENLDSILSGKYDEYTNKKGKTA